MLQGILYFGLLSMHVTQFISFSYIPLQSKQFSKDLKKKKAKSKRASSSQCLNLVDIHCENLKHTEIIYKDDDVRLLVELLLTISANLPKNNIKLTKVD